MKKKMGLSITTLNLRGRRLLILSSPAQIGGKHDGREMTPKGMGVTADCEGSICWQRNALDLREVASMAWLLVAIEAISTGCHKARVASASRRQST